MCFYRVFGGGAAADRIVYDQPHVRRNGRPNSHPADRPVVVDSQIRFCIASSSKRLGSSNYGPPRTYIRHCTREREQVALRKFHSVFTSARPTLDRDFRILPTQLKRPPGSKLTGYSVDSLHKIFWSSGFLSNGIICAYLEVIQPRSRPTRPGGLR